MTPWSPHPAADWQDPIANLTAPQVIEFLQPLSKKGSYESIRKLCRWLNEVMDFAVNTGLVHSNPLSRIRKAFKPPKTVNHPTIRPDELPQFMKDLEAAQMGGSSARKTCPL